jgi:hypothetical protein
MVARAIRTVGILEEDRIAILEQAQEFAVTGAERFPDNPKSRSWPASVWLRIVHFHRHDSGSFTPWPSPRR